MSTPPTSPRFIPALRFDALTRIYDPLVRLTTRERAFKDALIEQARLADATAMLDLGCGTGTLALLAKSAAPHLAISGVDADPAVLEMAGRKAADAGHSIHFEQGLADALPYPDRSFDRVLSTLLFHHLSRPVKLRAAKEVARVLEPGGELHVADWGRPHDPLMRVAFLGIQALDGFETTSDNVRGDLPQILAEAGLERVQERRRLRTPLGTIALLSAGALRRRPGPAAV